MHWFGNTKEETFMNRRYTLAGILLLLVWPCIAQALDIAWFEQRTAGSAEGEVRITRLQTGDLDIGTPGHDLEVGIMRYGNRAVVTLSRRSPAPQVLSAGRQAGPETLTVTARQGDATARATFKVVSAAPEALPETGPASARNRTPEEAAPADSPTGAYVGKEGVASTAPAMPGKRPLERPTPPASRLPDATCPVLTIRPGSLKGNINRLLNECDANMGEWVTYGGHLGVYTDWVVHDPEVLAENNSQGLEGLLEQLEHHYGLKGVRHPRLPHTIDVYKIDEEKE